MIRTTSRLTLARVGSGSRGVAGNTSLHREEALPAAYAIFIDTDLTELGRRLISRQTEGLDEIDRRL